MIPSSFGLGLGQISGYPQSGVVHFCTISTLVFVVVWGLKTYACKPITASSRQRSRIKSRTYLSPELLNLLCGNTIAILPPGFRKLRLRSIKRMSLSIWFFLLPDAPKLSSY